MTRTRPLVLTTLAASLLWLSGCDGNAANGAVTQDTAAPQAAGAEPAAAPAADAIEGLPFASTAVASFNEPWAIGFLPDGSVLITEKNGVLKHVTLPGGEAREISGVPAVGYAGQGGLGDVKPHPQFAENGIVYLSYAEDGEGGRGAAVARGRLDLEAGTLQDVSVIWRQVPKVDGAGHYGHRIAFDGDGKLWISSGERQKFDPSQNMQSNLGKVVRLNDDGSVPDDNPFAGKGEIASQVWSLGHRNPLGIAFDAQGRLWNSEMGPAGGDELNLVTYRQTSGHCRQMNRTAPPHKLDGAAT